MFAENRSQTVENLVHASPGTLAEQLARMNEALARSPGGIPPEWTRLAAGLMQVLAADPGNVEAAQRRARKQSLILRLGQQALATPDLSKTLGVLTREAATVLGSEFCAVVQAMDGGLGFVVRATQSGAPGLATPLALSDVQAAYTVAKLAPIVSPHLSAENRFAVPKEVLDLGVVSGLSVVVRGPAVPWGVLAVHSLSARPYSVDDIHFLEAVANLVALAVERDRVQTALQQRGRQQVTVAQLGRHALGGPHMEDFFREATRAVAETLDVEMCEILQRNGDAKALLLRAGVGWHPGVVGSTRVPALPNSQAGFAMAAEGPVVVSDLAVDERFEPSEILLEHGVVSSLTVVIPGRHRPFGLLGAHAGKTRAFSVDDGYFLQAVANLLAAAIERHGVEGELRRHRDDLEGLVEERTALLAASNRELEAFSYTISHDLRAPLRSINGLGKIVQRKYGALLAPQARELLQMMTDETVKMSALIEAILALSRLGTVEVKQEPVDVSALASSVLGRLTSQAPGRTVAWKVDPDIKAVGDPGLLRVVLENLLGNAWKFTARTNDAQIQVAGFAGGFSVADNGAGFDMAHARELFQPFHRLHGADDFEGMGIGLATVGRIAARHGGKVSAQGALGKGATFHVYLPPQMASSTTRDADSPGSGAASGPVLPAHK